MLTVTRVNKIIDLVAKEYPSIKNKPIDIVISTFKPVWSCGTLPREYELNISRTYDLEIDKSKNFIDLFLPYLKSEFNLDLTWLLADYQAMIDALVLLHEIGHVIQTSEMFLNDDTMGQEWRRYASMIKNAYKDYRSRTEGVDDCKIKDMMYRSIPYEYKADKFAVEIFNKYNAKILSILTGKSQKELKAIRESEANVLQEV